MMYLQLSFIGQQLRQITDIFADNFDYVALMHDCLDVMDIGKEPLDHNHASS